MTNNFIYVKLKKMFMLTGRRKSYRLNKDKIRKLNQNQVNPLTEQVKKVLTGVDQRLILMVRG